jgi:predicted naringenin-chalcone synthase
MSYIQAIGCAVPQNKFHQNALKKMVQRYHPLVSADRISGIYDSSAITTRYSVLQNLDKPSCAITETSLSDKMSIFKSEARNLALKAIDQLTNQISVTDCTHLITVSCTGLSAPGLDFFLIQDLGLATNIQRLTVNFMGCFAAFHALKLADHICNSQTNAKVLVVCVELCTLHIQEGNHLDLVVSNALFADGAAAAVIANQPLGLQIKSVFQDLIPETEQSMAWDLGVTRFDMKLANQVPKDLEKYLKQQKNLLKKQDIVHHALHPGGRKILEKYQETFDLSPEALSNSYEILKDFGNMSSATILFVLERFIRQKKEGNILAMGFGPGLTVEGMVLANSLN